MEEESVYTVHKTDLRVKKRETEERERKKERTKKKRSIRKTGGYPRLTSRG